MTIVNKPRSGRLSTFANYSRMLLLDRLRRSLRKLCTQPFLQCVSTITNLIKNFLNLLKTFVSCCTILLSLGWYGIAMLILNGLWYKYEFTEKKKIKEIEKERNDKIRDNDIEARQNQYYVRDLIIHRSDNVVEKLVNPKKRNAAISWEYEFKTKYFYMGSCFWQEFVMYFSMCYALYHNDFLSAIVILRSSWWMSHMFTTINNFNKLYREFAVNGEAVVEIYNKFVKRVEVQQIMPVFPLKFEGLFHSIKENGRIAFTLSQNGSISFAQKGRVLIDAPSGYGKSTLMKLICGFTDDIQVDIDMDGRKLTTFSHFISYRSLHQPPSFKTTIEV